MMCHSDTESVGVLSDTLAQFHHLSGLLASNQKSLIFLSGVSEDSRDAIVAGSGFQLGRLPIIYLGVPLISTKLKVDDCKMLVEKMTKLRESNPG